MSESRPKTNPGVQLAGSIFSWVPSIVPQAFTPLARFSKRKATYVKGNFLLGKAPAMVSSDGKGLNRLLVDHMLPAANENPDGRAYCYLGTHRVGMMITMPEDVRTLLTTQHDNLCDNDSSGIFKFLFGKTIFEDHYSKDAKSAYQIKRKKFQHHFMDPSILRINMPNVHQAVLRGIASIKDKKGVIALDEFPSDITMEMILMKIGLPLSSVPSTTKTKIRKIIEEVTLEVASGKAQLENLMPGFMQKLISICRPSKLMRKLKEGSDIIHDEILVPNREAIYSQTNWINDEKKSMNLDDRETVDSVKELLVIGHDTTKEALKACLRLAADPDNKKFVDDVLAEINLLKKTEPIISKWDRSMILSLKKLTNFINEALRLYPPVPDMIFCVKHMMHFAGGTFYPGDIFFISPRFVQRNKKVWGADADIFNPDRFQAHPAGFYDNFPFGFSPRPCVGQELARLNLRTILLHFLTEFRLKPLNTALKQPYKNYQMFTNQFEDKNVQLMAEMIESKEEAASERLVHFTK